MKYQEIYHIDGIGTIYSVEDNNGIKWFEFQDKNKKAAFKDMNLRSLIFTINLPEIERWSCLRWFQRAYKTEVI